MTAIHISHYSDVLCIWAYVSQVRLDELQETFGAQVELDGRFVSVFGDARGKLEKNWAHRGGAAAYRDHVLEVAAKFGHVPVHADVWVGVQPHSSVPAHAFLCAVRALEAEGKVVPGSFAAAAWRVRQAFFRDAADIGRRDVLRDIAAAADLPVAEVEARLDSGEACAALSGDFEQAREHEVRASPTLLFNEGRQRLTGNVGYRIIEANVRELLDRPSGQHSWC